MNLDFFKKHFYSFYTSDQQNSIKLCKKLPMYKWKQKTTNLKTGGQDLLECYWGNGNVYIEQFRMGKTKNTT